MRNSMARKFIVLPEFCSWPESFDNIAAAYREAMIRYKTDHGKHVVYELLYRGGILPADGCGDLAEKGHGNENTSLFQLR